MLRIIEAHPDEDFELPGALVHAVEKFSKKGYEPELLKSIKRFPNFYNLWMLSRLMNGVAGDERVAFRKVMQNVSDREDIDASIRKQALEFLQI